jgi:Na+-transporting NADH:ubiquinone oxidoreductase subunit C
MIVIVAALLSTAATVLKPFQEANARAAKMVEILKSFGVESSREQADELFNRYIVEEIAISSGGEVMSLYQKGKKVRGGDTRPFELDMKKELKKQLAGEPATFPLYKAQKEGKIFYVIPLYGKGLWGPIWGYIALKDDLKTVSGVTFGHKGETPGLGAEIEKLPFQEQFKNKVIWDAKGNFTPIDVVKGGVNNLAAGQQLHSVDGISGGTLTSNGVDAMLDNVLRIYKNYIVALRKK